MNNFIDEIGSAFTAYDGMKIAKGMGEMPTEQAVAHAKAVHTLLRKSTPVPISGASVSVTLEGKLELASGARLIYIEPEDIELLMEQCMLAMQARDSFTPDASDSMRVTRTPAPTDASATPGVVTGAAHVPRVGKDESMAHFYKVTEQIYQGRVQATKEASRPNFVRRSGFPW